MYMIRLKNHITKYNKLFLQKKKKPRYLPNIFNYLDILDIFMNFSYVVF